MTKFEAIRRLAQTRSDHVGRPLAIVTNPLRPAPSYTIREIGKVTVAGELVAIVQPGA